MTKQIHRRATGFTLLEVLVALIVLSIGLLGLAGLQASGLRSNHSGYLRSQATIFAYEMTDRMRANRKTALTGSYDIGFSDSIPSGTTIEDIDRKEWLNALAASLPSGKGAIDCNSSGLCTLTIQWLDDRNIDSSDPDYATKAFAEFPMTTQL